MNKLWFKRKLYGWGWTPSSWEGWSVLGVYLGVIVSIFKDIDKNSHSGSDTLINFVTPLIISTFILILICYSKGEKPKWQWGERKED